LRLAYENRDDPRYELRVFELTRVVDATTAESPEPVAP
jgi:hypothetical protein